MRFVYFTLNQNTKRSMQLSLNACFGIILVEISPANAFLWQVFYGWGQYEKQHFRCIILPDLNVTWTLIEIKWSKFFCFKWFTIVIFCIRLSGWCIRKGCSEGLLDFPKIMELWNRNVLHWFERETTKFGNSANKKPHVLLHVSNINCNLCFY